jgi:hypothetical protein
MRAFHPESAIQNPESRIQYRESKSRLGGKRLHGSINTLPKSTSPIFFFSMIPLARVHDAGPAKITKDFALVRPFDYGKPAHVVLQHGGDRIVQSFIGIGDDQVGRSNVSQSDTFIARTAKSANDVPSGYDAD